MADASRPDATANAADKDDLCLKMARALAVKARNAHIAGVPTTGQRCAHASLHSLWLDGFSWSHCAFASEWADEAARSALYLHL